MQLGMIGLGRMGANMVIRLTRAGHDLCVYDRHAETVREMEARGAKALPTSKPSFANLGCRAPSGSCYRPDPSIPFLRRPQARLFGRFDCTAGAFSRHLRRGVASLVDHRKTISARSEPLAG